ncbi:MAG: hypothetical protein VR69_07260 [Peptococcaceae bacterium BRH_c4b]|nr:MAG: hypothetical protein VR69_07260 [Peptococcaceae bacterium BRH_c4b]
MPISSAIKESISRERSNFLKKAKNRVNIIIFTTASGQYVYTGYEVQALQYLLKPINRQALAAALLVDLKKRFENRYSVFLCLNLSETSLEPPPAGDHQQ